MTTVATAPLRLSERVLADPPVVLAPMAGITNTAFRRLCREAMATQLLPGQAGGRDRQPNIQPQKYQRGAPQKRQPPPEGEELLVRQPPRQQQEHAP